MKENFLHSIFNIFQFCSLVSYRMRVTWYVLLGYGSGQILRYQETKTIVVGSIQLFIIEPN
jgi:hypothetical protein